MIIGLDGEMGKGSGRSVEGIDLGSAVIAAGQAGLLVNGGGHRMAAGLTVARDKLDALRAFLAERIGTQAAARDLVPTLYVDGAIEVRAAGTNLVAALDRLAPFGAGNPEPRFALVGARVLKADVVGGDHVRCVLGDGAGARIKAIAFRVAGEPLGRALMQAHGLPLSLAGRLRADNWGERNGVQLFIDDAAPA